LIYAPRPDYPFEARRRWLQGHGVFMLYIRPDGTVSSVKMETSTGSSILDRACVTAYSKWRFKPGHFTKAKVPSNFVIESTRH
jgi:periplasmic protein TonB